MTPVFSARGMYKVLLGAQARGLYLRPGHQGKPSGVGLLEQSFENLREVIWRGSEGVIHREPTVYA